MCPASDACGSIRFEEISTDNKSEKLKKFCFRCLIEKFLTFRRFAFVQSVPRNNRNGNG